MDGSWFESPWFTFGVMPLAIVLARVIDVSLGTMRIIYVSRGNKLVAPILGFFEVTIWLVAIGQVMANVSNVACYLAYGLGFALGNYLGILIDEKVAAGTVGVRIITQRKTTRLPIVLEENGYGVTTIEAQGGKGPVTMMYAVVPRKGVGHVLSLLNKYNPRAFYSIESVRTFDGGNHPSVVPVLGKWRRRSHRGRRPGK